MEITVNVSDLLRFVGIFVEAQREVTKRQMATALNTLGDSITAELSGIYENSTGMPRDEVRKLLEVQRATPGNLHWQIDAAQLISTTGRPLPLRLWQERPTTFAKEPLVDVITAEDGEVCPVCEQIAEEGPYTMSQIKALGAKWANYKPPQQGAGVRTHWLHPNAVLQGSRFMSYGAVTEMVRAVFSAHAITAETTSGRFTIGPNHPILSRRGWVKAHSLEIGDELLYDRRCDGSVIGRDLNFDQVPFVEDAFTAFATKSQSPYTRFPAADDLHGDARFCKGEVEIISPTSSLLFVLDPSGIEQFSEMDLVLANAELPHKSGFSPFSSFFEAALAPASGGMSGLNLVLAGSGSHPLPFDNLLLRMRSFLDVLSTKNSINNPTGNFEAIGQFQNTIARFVQLSDVFHWERVVSISHSPFHGLAFDATTESGLYNSDGFIVHNCRCAIMPRGRRRPTVSRGGKTQGSWQPFRGPLSARIISFEEFAQMLSGSAMTTLGFEE